MMLTHQFANSCNLCHTNLKTLNHLTHGGVLGILSDGDNQRIFFGLKFLIPGFFGIGNLTRSVFFGWLDLSRDYFGCSKQS